MSTAQATKNAITLKGSAAIITEYLSKYLHSAEIERKQILILLISADYGINSILFQRGIYPAENFQNHQQYGLTILMSTDDKIQSFLKNVLSQTEGNFTCVLLRQRFDLTCGASRVAIAERVGQSEFGDNERALEGGARVLGL